MSINVKGQSTNNQTEPEGPGQQLSYPTYAELQKAQENYMVMNCYICNKDHQINTDCSSKPRYPPSYYYNERCFICYGFHPKNSCWFEYLRETLTTPSYCSNCSVTHIGFCTEDVYCKHCNQCHNLSKECVQQDYIDLSYNPCNECGLYHSLHCPNELKKIQSDLILYCNKCKLKHKYFKCVPFCDKCLRRHQEGFCPDAATYCRLCAYCHQDESCPQRVRK